MDTKDFKGYRTAKISAKKIYIFSGSLFTLILIAMGLSILPCGSSSVSVSSKSKSVPANSKMDQSDVVTNGKIIFLESNGTFSPPFDDRNSRWDFNKNSIFMPKPSSEINNFSFFTMNPDGTDLKKLEIEPPETEPSLIFSNISLPTFSFDGKMIAFLRQNEDKLKCSLFIMNSDGGKAKRLASSVDREFGIAFTPDNQNIIYQNDDSKVYSVNIETRVTSLYNDHIYAVYPKFTADGKFLLVESEGGWYSNIEFRNAVDGKIDYSLVVIANQNSHFSISPDSKFIACTTTSQCVTDDSYEFNLEQICIMNLQDIDPHEKTKKIIFTGKNKSNHLEYVNWSPDGKYLLVRIRDFNAKECYLALINLKDPEYTVNRILKENGESIDGVELSWQSIVV